MPKININLIDQEKNLFKKTKMKSNYSDDNNFSYKKNKKNDKSRNFR